MKALVIGGGIAGCSAAASLAQRGADVLLLEKSEVASAASGNPLGILHPRMEKQWNPATRFYLAAFYYARHMLQRQGGKGEWWDSPGMLQFHKRRDPAKSDARLRELPESLGLAADVARYVEAPEASEIAGIASSSGALYFPGGTWVEPKRWCDRMLAHPSLTVMTGQHVRALQKQDAGWLVMAGGHNFTADVVILANARDVLELLPDKNLPISTSRGQLSFLPFEEASAGIQAILCYEGYVSPARNGMHLCGSTYEYGRQDLIVDPEGHQHNLSVLQRLWPQLFAEIHPATMQGRAALRTVTPDRLPILGELEEGLYLSVGHGSRGLLSAPLGAELLASAIFHEPLPCDSDVAAALSPLRFKPQAL